MAIEVEFLTLDYDECPPDKTPSRFGFACPKRAGFMCTGLLLHSNPEGHKLPNQMWTWDGNREKPTFTPSINCNGCSHGFIRNGEWVDA